MAIHLFVVILRHTHGYGTLWFSSATRGTIFAHAIAVLESLS
jgi:hypothetical protein